MGLANAQLSAAIPNNDFYEQLVMDEAQITALAESAPVAVVNGHIEVSREPGLGHQYDWEHLDDIALTRIEVTEDGVRERRRERRS
jgi:L-alanine-DL-glutamate epimerase-like enolase superfamily enzyme